MRNEEVVEDLASMREVQSYEEVVIRTRVYDSRHSVDYKSHEELIDKLVSIVAFDKVKGLNHLERVALGSTMLKAMIDAYVAREMRTKG